MSTKQSYATEKNERDPRETKQKEYSTRLETPPSVTKGKANPSVWLNSANPAKARILIVSDDNVISNELEATLLDAGFVSERAKTMSAGCESARSGQFQVVVSAPVLHDGSWKRLADIDSHHRPGFVIILVATNLDLYRPHLVLEEGAFEIVDALHDLQKIPEITRRAFWAAYLKGAGPRPEANTPGRVA